MKSFPDFLKVENKANFSAYTYNRMKCYLRRDIYEHIISHEEKEYFSLDDFTLKTKDPEMTKKLVNEIIPELEKLGWRCKTSFGGTGLFIYSGEKPANCWED